LEFRHLVQWRCSIVLAYIRNYQQEEGLSLKHMAWPEQPQTMQERGTSSTISNCENLNALCAHINRQHSQPTKKTVIHKSNPTRTLCVWKVYSISGRVSNWLSHLH
jgi:hypothetical protein